MIIGRFLIFVAAVLVLSLAGLAIWRVWSRVDLHIKRDRKAFDVESEAYDKMKNKIKEDEE